MDKSLRVLFVEDNRLDVKLLMAMLSHAGVQRFEFTIAARLWEALEILQNTSFDAILLDLNLPDSTELNTLKDIRRASPDVPIVVLTGVSDENMALTAVQLGAQDYLVKNRINSELLQRSIQYAVERQRMQTELRELALRDPLTGLYNRRGFITLAEQQLHLAKRAGAGLWLCFADLDGLKKINDQFGHAVADQALVDIAENLREVFRVSDIIARYGGDEFIAMGIASTTDTSKSATTRLNHRLEAINAQGTRLYPLSVSLGWTHFDTADQSTLDDLIRYADQAMYTNKANKRGTNIKQAERSK